MSTRSTDGTRQRTRRRSATKDDRELMLEAHLSACRVAELQQMWGFWQNGTRPPSRKPELLAPLVEALTDESTVRSRVEVLSVRPREVLVRLVRSREYSASLSELVRGDDGRSLESYEVEAAARALVKRGFVRVDRPGRSGRRAKESYRLPRDLGDLIAGILHEEKRGPREVFSLHGFLASLPARARRRVLSRAGVAADDTGTDDGDSAEVAALVDAVLDGRTGRELLEVVGEEALADALWSAAVTTGGVIPRADFDASASADELPDRQRLRGLLEEAGIGTVSSLNLDDYGIDLDGAHVVVHGEIVERVLDARREQGEPAHERVAAARVDLLTDLQQFLNLVATTSLRVTQGRTIYRAAQHRVLDALIFCEDALMDRRRIFGMVYDLAFQLELVEVTDDSRLRLTRRGLRWDAVSLGEKVRAVYDKFLEERLPEGRDFHVRRLRRALAAALLEAPAERLIAVDDVPFRVRNHYLGTLEEGVKELYRNRFQYTYSPPTESPAEIARRLVGYMLARLYPLGLVDVALEQDEAVAVRLSELGRRMLSGEPLDDVAEGSERGDGGGPSRSIIVNPDFEVLLFPDADVNAIAHELGRFAVRTKSEEVAHYRIGRAEIERAVVKGLGADEILAFLERHGRVPVPQNVAYSIRSWAERVGFAEQQPVVLFETSTEDAMERALGLPAVARLVTKRVSPTAVALRSAVEDWRVIEKLRKLGVYLK